jgi:nucleotide-binding universal stress UspA family protein
MLPALLPLEQHEEFYLRTYVKAGDIVEEVLMALEEEPPDFVIMGRHGRGLIAHALIGSVAQGVLSSARVPVITVGPVMDTPAFDTVVLAMDFDERSRNKVQFVSQMARDLHAELVLSHALDVELEGGAEAAVYMSESRIEEARARITELIASVPGASPKISVRVAERSIADTILQDAYEQSADLIAVGLENPDEAGRLSFASTIPGRVIRDAHVPVVLIPANLRLARDTGVKKAA